MDITLKNFAAKLSKDLIQLAKKNPVRECDEVKKGNFVAYVDEGSESYDVSLGFGAGGKVTAHSCDCSNGANFCRHKAALLMHLAAGAKTAGTGKVSKKESKTETLLNNAGSEELREWVRGLIAKNKDIELSFVHHFSVKEQPTPAEVVSMTNEAVKAVAGNKKAIDATQLKKLVELWGDMHAPMMTHYRANPTDEKSFLNFHAMLETCMAFNYKVQSGSNKITKFIETALEGSLECVANLYNEEAWDTAVGFFVRHVPEGDYDVRLHYLAHLNHIINSSVADRQAKVANRLARQFGEAKPEHLHSGAAYQKFIFAMVVDYGLFEQYYRLFKPISFDNVYNLALIGLLIDGGHFDLAKKYSEAQIRSNYQKQFDVPYRVMLKRIFVLQNDRENLLKVLTELVPYTFDMDDYLFVSASLVEEEQKKWRSKVLARASNFSNERNKHAAEFCFKLADYEHKYSKMPDYIGGYTPYELILSYFEKMMLGDRNRLLERLVRKSDDDVFGSHPILEEDMRFLPELYQLMLKYYGADVLKMAVRSAEKDKWSRLNRLIKYVKERISE